MKIIIIGNICAGKTTVGNYLKQKLKFPFYPLDKFRIKYADGTVAGEYRAYSHLISQIENKESIMMEFTGVGVHKHAIRYALKLNKHPYGVIWVQSPKPRNVKKKIHQNKTVPFPFSIDIRSQIPQIKKELDRDWQENFWEIPSIPHICLIFQNLDEIKDLEALNQNLQDLSMVISDFISKESIQDVKT